VIGKNSDLTTLYCASYLIRLPVFVYYESCAIPSAMLLIRIPYPPVRRWVYAPTYCLLVEAAGCVNCVDVLETWCNTGRLTKVCLERIGIGM